ncbi:BREX-1 system phosphatase PglZ type A [Desulfonatronum parangueonense]
MNDRITQALSKLFDRHRIVFWYDAKQELRADYEALDLPGVAKTELANNEYAVKYRILREEPDQKFLIFRDGPQPDDLDNWLLDVQLAHGEFRTDQVALWLSELELGLEFADLAQEHAEFFQAAKRRDALKSQLKSDDTPGLIRLKILAVCAGSEARLDSVMEYLLAELTEGRDEKIKLIDRCGLSGFLWQQMSRSYGYGSDEPGVRDFAVELFKSCYAMGTDGEVRLTGDALVFLKRWKDSRQFESSFETLSEECAEVLGMEKDLAQRDFRELIELDYFELIDRKVISDLVHAVAARTVSSGDVTLWVRQRRPGHWYMKYRDLYKAVDYASQFLHALSEAQLNMENMADGIQRYTRFWYKLDQLYRKFTYHVRSSGQASLLSDLADQIENLYANNFLLKVNDAWQVFVDQATKWDIPSFPLQKRFFDLLVTPYLQKDIKVCVIISDALRYEIGEELVGMVRQEDRYMAEIKPMVAMLPSYTQLGMAALLPHKELRIADNETGTIFVDGQSSQGLSNRIKILQQGLRQRATALKADDFMSLKGDDARSLIRDHDVIYLYHNRIDRIGDKLESEEHVFAAVQESLLELIRLIKKLAGANTSNILITADHGFIYQNRAIEESDFSGVDAEGEQILYRDRRFVIGNGLKESSSLKTFSSEQLGLAGDVQIQVPKSINRLRLKGSGSRFVHGGAALQEMIIPVLKINKKRQSDVSTVDVEILRGSSTVITSGQLSVGFYQSQPVTDKMHPRKLRTGIYTEAGELISDVHELTFDLTSDNPREREFQVRFVLSRKADDANNQEVILKLEEKHAGTSHYKEYKSLRYMMRRSFTSDFDF